MTSKTKFRVRGRAVTRWHRRIGIAASLVILIVVITGIPLNHADKLGLNSLKVGYQIIGYEDDNNAFDQSISFSVGKRKLSWYRGALYLNEVLLGEGVDEVVGVVIVKGQLVVATTRAISIFSENGLLIEKILETNIPGKIAKIGTKSGIRLFLKTSEGQYVGVGEFIDWTQNSDSISFSQPTKTNEEFVEKLKRKHFGDRVTWSRFLLEVHTGRIFGKIGPYLVDLAALSLIFLLATGIYNAISRRHS